MSEPVVRVIKANPFNYGRDVLKKDSNLLRVAAYARVSTDKDEQEDSFERQVTYYTNFIQANPKWEFVKVYSDPGISGTRADKRPGFLEMMEECKKGNIDRILVKSIARFARNTVDSLKYIRELQAIGVSVYFETQNIDTGTPGGDVLLAILSAMAEEESRTISKNVKWSYQKKFEKGEFVFNYTNFLGLDKDRFGNFYIVEEEAKIIRRIYRDFLSGKSICSIARELTEEGVKTPSNKDQWRYSVVKSILTNEKYYGAAIMGKTFKPDVLTKYRVKNTGQADSYYVENVLPPIVSKETFKMVQLELEKRKGKNDKGNKTIGKFASKYPFSNIIRCGCCGALYNRSNNLRVNGKKVPSWWCSAHRAKATSCSQNGISEQAIKNAFIKVFGELVENYDEIKMILMSTIEEVLTDNPREELDKLESQLIAYQEEMLQLHKKKTNKSIDAKEYARLGSQLAEKINRVKVEMEQYEKSIDTSDGVRHRLQDIVDAIESTNPIKEFDEELFRRLVESITITERYKLTFKFRCGIEKTIISEEK